MKKSDINATTRKADFILVQNGLFEYPPKKDEEPQLLASQCSKCGATFFPQRPVCRHCLDGAGMKIIRLSPHGVVYASTVINVDSPSGIKAPYAFGYVDIAENNIRVFALFEETDAVLIAPGRAVEVVIEAIATNRERQHVVGYKYRARQREIQS